MKIAECSDSFLPIVDGVGTVVSAYANNLAKRGNEVYVIAPLDNTGYRGNLPYEIVDFTSIKMSKKLPWKLGLESIDTHFSERIKMIDLDIVHVHSPGIAGLVGIKTAKRKGIPVVGSFHSKYYDDILKVTHVKAFAKLGSKIVADFYKHCDEVWAVSENAGNELRRYGYKGPLAVMPNGTNKRVLKKEKLPEVIEQFNIRQDVPVFLFVGQISWKKNIIRILESCAQLKREGLDFQLVFVGRGPDEKQVQRTAGSLGLKDNLIMTGHLDNTDVLDCLYSLAELFLFPSLYDNSPMVIREAAAMHTPSVVVKGSSSAEVVVDMENSLTCENSNRSMADTIKKYLNLKKTEKNRIRSNAYKTIPIEWDGELMDKILARYQNVINNHENKNERK